MSESTKGTPGPWHYQEVSDAYTHIVRGPNNYFVTQLSQDTSGRSEADARLMAAAPELLEACRESLRLVDGEDWLHDLREQLTAVIAKAGGTR